MARRALGLGDAAALSVAGGMTFFGAPLNNYMTHAAVAMVRRLRAEPRAAGLLYGQGEYVTKHHALVLAAAPSCAPLVDGHRRPKVEASVLAAAPPLVEAHTGPAVLETFTVLFDRAGEVRHGAVIARTPAGARLLARLPAGDRAAIARLLDASREPVGAPGAVAVATDGLCDWRFA